MSKNIDLTNQTTVESITLDSVPRETKVVDLLTVKDLPKKATINWISGGIEVKMPDGEVKIILIN